MEKCGGGVGACIWQLGLGCTNTTAGRGICWVKNSSTPCKASPALCVGEVFWKTVDVWLFLKRRTAEGNLLPSELNT